MQHRSSSPSSRPAKRWLQSAWATVLAATVAGLAACGGGDDTGARMDGRAAQSQAPWAPSAVMPAELAQPDLTQRARSATAKSAPEMQRFALGPLPTQLKQLRLQMPGKAVQIGAHRDVAALRKGGGSNLAWRPADDGAQLAALSLSSAGAVGLRAGLVVNALPDLAVVRVYAPGADIENVFSGQQINALLALNRAAGELGEDGRTWWAPYVDGETVVVEITVPAGVDTAQVVVPAVQVSHFWQSPLSAARGEQPKLSPGASDSCNLDAACYPGNKSQRDATAHLIYSKTGGSFICTGTLMNDSAGSNTPYLLTANHCFNTQSSASSVQTHWFAESASCGSGATSQAYTTRNGGGTLLYASAATDVAFMRLGTTPPAGAVFSGWFAGQAALGTSSVGVHHPSGDLKKISFGSVRGYANCADNGTGFSCSNNPSGNYVDIQFTQGTTEGGSSGSGVWATINGNPLLIGQLYGGNSSCTNRNGSNIYGRFDVSYNAALSAYLGAGGGGGGTTPPPVSGSATPATGWWWVQGESGRGFALELRGTVIYMAGFMYEDNGRDTWNSSDMRRTASGSYTGELRSYAGGNDRLLSPGGARGPVGSTVIANVEVAFTSSSAGTLRITQGASSKTMNIVRFPVSATGAVIGSTASFENGWYYTNGENGHGYFIEVQGNDVFMASYTYYNSTGVPGWYIHQAKLVGTTQFSTTNDWYSGGQTLMGAYRAPTGPNRSGTMSYRATSATTGVLTFTTSAGTVNLNIQRFVF